MPRAGRWAAGAAPLAAQGADEDEGERRGDEDSDGVASPQFLQAEGGGRGIRPATSAVTPMVAPTRRAQGARRQTARTMESAVSRVIGKRIQRRAKKLPAIAWSEAPAPTPTAAAAGCSRAASMKARVDVGDDRAGKNCRPDAVTVDEHRRERDPGGWEQRRHVARRDGEVKCDEPADRVAGRCPGAGGCRVRCASGWFEYGRRVSGGQSLHYNCSDGYGTFHDPGTMQIPCPGARKCCNAVVSRSAQSDQPLLMNWRPRMAGGP